MQDDLQRKKNCFFAFLDKKSKNKSKSKSKVKKGNGKFFCRLLESIFFHLMQFSKRRETEHKTFCVGHDLGAHACGFMGRTGNEFLKDGKKALDRIIALDPSGIEL